MTIVLLSDISKLGPGGHHINKEYVYIRQHPVGEIEYWYDDSFVAPVEITPKYKAKLCWGDTHGFTTVSIGPYNTSGRCDTCLGVWHTNLYKCTTCCELFIKDFSHPKFCYAFPKCWDCVGDLPWEQCPVHNLPGMRLRPIKEPTGMNIEATPEQVKAAFDFFGITPVVFEIED